MTSDIPADFTTVAVPAHADDPTIERPPAGLIRHDVTGYDRAYWAFVPELFPNGFPFGVVIWLQPTDGPRQEQLVETWRTACNRRGLIFLAPSRDEDASEWTAEDAVFIGDCLKDLKTKYTINEKLIVLHTAGDATTHAARLQAAHVIPTSGLILLQNKSDLPIPANAPEHNQFFLLLHSESDQEAARFDESLLKKFLEQRLPTAARGLSLEQGYLTPDSAMDVARWIVGLERI